MEVFKLFASLELDDTKFNQSLDRAERSFDGVRRESDRAQDAVDRFDRTARTATGDVDKLDRELDDTADSLDQVGRKARTADRELDRMGGPSGGATRARKGITGLAGSLRSFAAPAIGAAGAIWGAQGLARGLNALASGAERAENAQYSFEKQLERSNVDTATANDVVDRLSERFGVLPQTVQEATTLLLRAGGSMGDVERALTAAGASAAAAGTDITRAFDNVSTAVATGRSELLESSGIVANLGPVQQEYAESIGKTVEELTDAELIQARVNAIYAESSAEIEDVDKLLSGLVGTQSEARSEWVELMNTLGELVLPVAQTAIRVFGQAVGAVNDWIDTWRSGRATTAQKAIGTVRDRVREFGEASTVTATALGTLTEATDKEGFTGALDTLISTLDEDGQRAMRDFADAHVLPLVAAGNLQDAVDLSVKEVMRLRLEAAEAAADANDITWDALKQRQRRLAEAEAAYRRTQERYAEGRRLGAFLAGDPQYEAEFERQMQGFAETQIALSETTEALRELSGEQDQLAHAIGVMEGDLAALESGAMTAEEYVQKLRDSLAALDGTSATAGVDVTPDPDNPDATEEDPTGLLTLERDGITVGVSLDVEPLRMPTPQGVTIPTTPAGTPRGSPMPLGAPAPQYGTAADGGLGGVTPVQGAGGMALPVVMVGAGTGGAPVPMPVPISGANSAQVAADRTRTWGFLDGYGTLTGGGPRADRPGFGVDVDTMNADQRARQDQAIFDAAWGGTDPADHSGSQYGERGSQTEATKVPSLLAKAGAAAQSFGQSVMNAATAKVPAFGAAIEGFATGGPIGALTGAFSALLGESEAFQNILGILSQAFEPLVQILDTLFAALTPIVQVAVALFQTALQPLVMIIENVVAPVFEGVANAIKWIWNGIADALNAVLGWLGVHVPKIGESKDPDGLLESLQSERQALVEKRAAAKTEAEIEVYNRAIAEIDRKIDDLLGLGLPDETTDTSDGGGTGSEPPPVNFGGTPQAVQLAVATPLVEASYAMLEAAMSMRDVFGGANLDGSIFRDFTGALDRATPVLNRLADGIDVRVANLERSVRSGSRTAHLRGA